MRNQLDKAIRRVMAARHAKHRRAGDTGTVDDTFRQLASAPSRHRDDGR